MAQFLEFDKLAESCFIFGIYMKQFYFLKSGSFQIGDFFLVFSLIVSAYSKKIKLSKKDNSIFLFIIISSFINILYSLIYADYSFVIYISYLIYSLFIIIIFRNIFDDEFFEKNIVLTLKLSMLTQLFFYGVGWGKNYSFDRYEGTFNDPNQFAFYTLASFYISWLYSGINGKRLHLIWYIIILILISISASTGMMLCFSAFILFSSNRVIYKKKKIVLLTIFIVQIILFLILNKEFLLTILIAINENLNFSILSRIIEKIGKFSSDNYADSIYRFLIDRNMVRILLKPEFFLFGSGEGGWNRFYNEDMFGGELHSTAIGLCYYYGILPYMFFLKWIKKNLECIDISYTCVYIALFIETFTLANHRQPFFWMLIILGSHPTLKKKYHNLEA